MNIYVVESPVRNAKDQIIGTARHWVTSEERAKEEVAKRPDLRTWRLADPAEVPSSVRANFEAAAAQL